MICLEDLTKMYDTRNGPRTILRNINFTVMPHEKVGILGRNGAGKSTMVRMLSGAERPTSGRVVRQMSVSWPLAFGGAFQSSLSGYDNLRFICRIYNKDVNVGADFVEEFSELGRYMREPIRSYSSGMRARLAFAISMLVEFDCFLIDEIMAVGDVRFQRKCHAELFERRADRSMIIVSHDDNFIRTHCDRAVILHEGELIVGEGMEETIAHYHRLMQ